MNVVTRRAQANWLVLVAVLCAMTTTGVVVRREYLATRSRAALKAAPVGRVVRLTDEERERVESVGHRIGGSNAELVVVVFSDWECPACGWFATSAYPKLKAKYGERITLKFRHWPLAKHKFAYAAARASECAAAQGKFESIHNLMFAEQKLIGLKGFADFAKESGVPDRSAFAACIADTTRVAAVERDVDEAQRIGGTGTPTIVMNGWHLAGGAGFAMLDSVAHALIDGEARDGNRSR